MNYQDPQLPTGAMKLRVNSPGFPWINQELSQGQAGEGEEIGRSQPFPRRVPAQQQQSEPTVG